MMSQPELIKQLDDALKWLSSRNKLYSEHNDLKREVFENSDDIDVEAILIKLRSDGFIHYGLQPNPTHFKISIEGYDLIRAGGYSWKYERDAKEKSLAEKQIKSAIDANSSALSVNESTQILNKYVLPQSFVFQKKIGRWSIILAAVSSLFILITVYLQAKDTQRAAVIRLWIRKTAVAAGIVGLLCTATVWLMDVKQDRELVATVKPVEANVKEGQFETREIVNDTKKNMTITTEDSSVITVFPSSMVRYTVPFHQGRRDVYLEGAANFKVARDKNRPFSVYGGGVATTALGTEFKVNTKEAGKKVKVQLFEGKVVVKSDPASIKGWEKDIYLEAGQQLLFEKSRMLVTVEKIPSLKPVEARTIVESKVDEKGKTVVFDNTALPQVLDRLAAYYDKKISFDKNDLQQLNFTGTVSATDSIEVVLKVIAQMNDLIVNNENGIFKIDKKQLSPGE